MQYKWFLISLLSLTISESFVYWIDRGFGDLFFLLASLSLAVLCVRISSKANNLGRVAVGSLVLSSIVLVSNSYFVDLVRNKWLNLGEDFGHSALLGIVVFFVLLPSIAVSIIAAVLMFISRTKNS